MDRLRARSGGARCTHAEAWLPRLRRCTWLAWRWWRDREQGGHSTAPPATRVGWARGCSPTDLSPTRSRLLGSPELGATARLPPAVCLAVLLCHIGHARPAGHARHTRHARQGRVPSPSARPLLARCLATGHARPVPALATRLGFAGRPAWLATSGHGASQGSQMRFVERRSLLLHLGGSGGSMRCCGRWCDGGVEERLARRRRAERHRGLEGPPRSSWEQRLASGHTSSPRRQCEDMRAAPPVPRPLVNLFPSAAPNLRALPLASSSSGRAGVVRRSPAAGWKPLSSRSKRLGRFSRWERGRGGRARARSARGGTGWFRPPPHAGARTATEREESSGLTECQPMRKEGIQQTVGLGMVMCDRMLASSHACRGVFVP